MPNRSTNRVLFLLCVMYFITYVDRVNVSTAAIVFGKEFGPSNTQVGFVFSAFGYPYLLFQIIGDNLATLASLMRLLFIHDSTVAAICLSLGFFFAEMTIGPMWAIPMDIAPKYSGTASGIMNSGSALAAILSPVVAGC